MQGGIALEWLAALGSPFPGPAPGPASRASHLLPECTVVTVVGLGLRSAPTPETPDEEETRLQSVEGARPAGGQWTQGVKAPEENTLSPFPRQGLGGANFYTLDSKFLPTCRKTFAMCP